MTLADASRNATRKLHSVAHVAHVTFTDAITATVTWGMRPDRAGIAIEAFLLGLLFINDRVFLYAVVALAFVINEPRRHTGRNAIVHAWNAKRRRDRLKHGNKKLPTIRAVIREAPITPKAKAKAWLTTTSERVGITPALRLHTIGRDPLGEVLTVGVPTSPSMNPSVLAHNSYRERIRACVQGDCYGVHIWADEKRGGIAHIRIVRSDIRKVEAGPSSLITTPPVSIMQPVQVGISAMREPVLIDLMARSGIGIFGMNGTGKSVLLHTFVGHIGSCADAYPRLGDMKDGMDGAPYRNRITYTEEPDEVHDWIAMWAQPKATSGRTVDTWRRSELAMERSKMLQSKDLEKWTPTCGVPAEFIVIDEVDNISPNDQFALAWIINKLRAIGVRVIIASQLPRADTLDRRLSTALNLRISFRVADVDAAGIALGKGAVGRGFDASTLPVPGYCYVLGSDQQDATIVRTHLLEPRDVKAIVGRFPTRKPAEGYASGEDSYADLTDLPGPMEGSGVPSLTESDPIVEPPDDARPGTARRVIWDAMPNTRGELAKVAGITPEHTSSVLRKWASEGKAINVGGVWQHRRPLHVVGDLA